jgi:hypothetical protein
MELIVYNDAISNAEPLEIGRTSAISFNLMDGSKFRLTPMNVHNQRILLEGWATPQLFTSTPYQQLYRFTAALVQQMGGSVTIQPYELREVNDRNLNIYQQADPFYWVLKMKED